MRKKYAAVSSLVLILVVTVSLILVFWRASPSEAEQLYQQASNLERQGNYRQAGLLYYQALPKLLAESSTLTQSCREGAERMELFQATYPYTEQEVRTHLANFFPDVSAQQINGWIESGEIGHTTWDGITHYSLDAAENLRYSHLDLMQANASVESKYSDLLSNFLTNFVEKPVQNATNPYQAPATYEAIYKVDIPREVLPNNGTLQMWMPLPIDTDCQNVTIESINPQTYVEQPASIDKEIGLLYLKVPLEQLQGNLTLEVKFSFTHYEQRFTINPANIGTYDKTSALYTQYTRSYGNTEKTPQIRALAAQIVGAEANPYLAARKIYNYVVENITYAFMPHLVMWPRTNATESAYVDQYRRGDCGAQSLYFVSMCRSLGIPARTTGGWQLFSGDFSSHFWAEFYLPNYGWVPVDTSAAQLGYYPKNATAQQRQEYIDYFFANQDSMRCVVQRDIDVPLIPPTSGMVILPMAIQNPTALCDTIVDTIPTSVIGQYATLHCQKVS